MEEVKKNISEDPTSDIGIQLGEKMMQWVNGLYGKKYAHLRTKKFEKGFGEGRGLAEAGLTPELVSWLEKAMDSYWRQRIYAVLAQVGKMSPSEVLHLWHAALDDMYGEDAERKKAIFDVVIQDDTVSSDAKKWLRSLSAS